MTLRITQPLVGSSSFQLISNIVQSSQRQQLTSSITISDGQPSILAFDPSGSTFDINLPINPAITVRTIFNYGTTGSLRLVSSGIPLSFIGFGGIAIIVWDGTTWQIGNISKPVVSRIILSPATSSNLSISGTVGITASLFDFYGTPILGKSIQWSTGKPLVATVNNSGTVSLVGSGSTLITASVDGVSGFSSVTIPQIVTSLTISPPGPYTLATASVQFIATVYDQTSGTVAGQTILWSGSNPTVISVNSASGVVSIVNSGSAFLTASVVGTNVIYYESITVPTPVPAALALNPFGIINIPNFHGTQSFVPTVFSQFGTVMTGQTIFYSSSNQTFVSASVSASIGIATSEETSGSIQFIATVSGTTVTQSVTITTPPPVPATMSVSPTTLTLINSGSVFLTASLFDQWGAKIINPQISYSSSLSASINVSISGSVTGIRGNASATIVAYSPINPGISATCSCVTNAPVATSVVISPATASIIAGASIQLTAITLDQYLQVFGSVQIPTTLVITPSTGTLSSVGQSMQFSAQVLDQAQNVIINSPILWSIANAGVATINSSSGVVTEVAVGTTIITAQDVGTSVSGTALLSTNSTTNTPNQPAGFTTVINTGPISSLATFLSQWTMFSPSTISNTGEWSGNLVQVPPPDTGIRVMYQPSLTGGGSPVRFGTPVFTFSGTGWYYMSWRHRFSLNWSFSQAGGIKQFLPRSVVSGNNDFFSWNCQNSGSGLPDSVSAWPNFGLQGNRFLDLPGAPGGSIQNHPNAYLSPNANIQNLNKGAWHLIEFLIQPETTLNVSNDGQWSVWIDNVLMFTTIGLVPGGGNQSTGVGTGLPSSGVTWDCGGFTTTTCDATYGGDVATDHPPGCYWDADQIYISVK